MQKFWYVVEAHGRQVLIQKAEDSDGFPSIQLVTHVDDGAELSMGFNFCGTGDERGEEDMDRLESERDNVFDTKEADLRTAAEAFAEKLIGCVDGLSAVAALRG